jgi:5-methylcytosine-specific restriction endonuclease McrA
MVVAAAPPVLPHLPSWFWGFIAVVGAFSIYETRRRAERKRLHREYLRSRGWKERRRLALRRAANRCQDCGAAGKLDVHHRTYRRWGNELPNDLRVLCAKCHRRRHSRNRSLIDVVVDWICD